MLLTLEVISPNGDLLGSNRRKTVGPEGVQIGRSKESDWVINDQYISRIHARVRYVNGAFYIEGLGRNPLAINDPDQTIANNEPHLLRNGDRFFLDQYEIKVLVSTGQAATPAQDSLIPGGTIPDDPFAPAPSQRAPTPVPHSWSSGSVDVGIADGTVEDAAHLDPLAALGGPAPRREAPLPPVDLHQRSVLEDSYRAPSPVMPTPPAGSRPVIPTPHASAGGKIPDAWDRSGFTQMGQQPAPTPPPPRRPAAPPPAMKPGGESARSAHSADDSVPDTWDKSRTRLEQASPTAKLPPLAQSIQDAAHKTAHTIEKPRPPAVSHTVRRPAEAPVTPPPAPVHARAPAEPAAPAGVAAPAGAHQGSLSLEEMLRAAGVPATHMSPEMAAELGQVLRIVVQGLMEVLQSRAEIKSQLRMSMTRMQATENNPLKFSPNVEAALHTLLVERNRGYLPTTRAFQEALTDIRNHQIAVLQGIRSAFDAMLEQFDPEKLEADLERQSKRGGLLNLGGKARFRDYYVEQFASMTRDPDESFKRLFGEYFAQAYEAQMDRLKAAGRTAGG